MSGLGSPGPARILAEGIMHAAAIILARGGSKGIPGKNLRRIEHRTLLNWAIQACLDAKTIDAVFVSTEDGAIAKEASVCGATVSWRPLELATDTALGLHALLYASERLDPSFDTIANVECTCFPPMPALIDQCVLSLDQQQADSAVTVCRDVVWLWRRREDGYGFPVNQFVTANRQTASVEYRLTGQCFASRRRELERTRQQLTGRIALVETVDEQVDIDTPLDFAIAELIAFRNSDKKHLGI